MEKCKQNEVVGAVRRVTLYSIVINLLLSCFKFFVGIVGSSQAMMADGIHSLSDTTTDLAVFFGVRFWSAPADDKHPYGHWRIEGLVTVSIGLMLAGVAVGICWRAVGSLQEPVRSVPGLVALIGAVVSIVVKELLYRWTIMVGRATGSSALEANAWHHRTDALSSIPVVIAIILARINPALVFADQVGAIVVAVFVMYAAWKIVWGALGDLLDRGAAQDVQSRIEEIVLSVPGAEEVHAIRTRRMGPGIYLDLHLLVDGELSVREGHDIAEAVRRVLLEKGPRVLDAVVHLEPAGE